MNPPVVALRQAGLTYPGPPSTTALSPTDLVIQRGEFISVVGPSGSGKSTLLNILGLIDKPTAGVYELDGVDTTGMTDRQRAAMRGHRLGFVFQAFHLLDQRTAVENVMLAVLYRGVPVSRRRAAASEALDRVGLAHRRTSLPSQMSGGERQRVAIARGVVGRPSLLLCDEPTGNLDRSSAAGVLELIESLSCDGMTVVLVSHDPTVAARGHRTVEIIDGQLRERPR
jgi:putative ABC transport system ATP-binding protein